MRSLAVILLTMALTAMLQSAGLRSAFAAPAASDQGDSLQADTPSAEVDRNEAGRTDPSLDMARAEQLVAAAHRRLEHQVRYDGRYLQLDYPNGDPPDDIGVCTDLVVRAYRQLGIDLQQLVHEDMRAAFSEYPDIWGLQSPDSNIDHRRVPNLETFFTRHGEVLPVTRRSEDYLPGDLVTWRLSTNPNELRGPPHIGVVSSRRSADGQRPLIVHNIGAGPILDDMLFAFPIKGHYRFLPEDRSAAGQHHGDAAPN